MAVRPFDAPGMLRPVVLRNFEAHKVHQAQLQLCCITSARAHAVFQPVNELAGLPFGEPADLLRTAWGLIQTSDHRSTARLPLLWGHTAHQNPQIVDLRVRDAALHPVRVVLARRSYRHRWLENRALTRPVALPILVSTRVHAIRRHNRLLRTSL